MKKFVLFTMYATALISVAIYALQARALPHIVMWLNQHIYYLVGLLVLHIGLFLTLFFLQRKKLMQQSSEDKDVANFQLRLNIKAAKEGKLFLLLTSLFLIYCGTVLFFFDWSYQNFTILVSGISLTYLGVVTILFWAYQRNNKWKLEKALQVQESTALKLRSIRSQLNPHFMFNALTSIQNLMNKNDILAANHYLAMFADLTRRVLNTGDQELISLEDELKILEDYLQMEQLRFGFRYQIVADENINIANTQIPAMVLQPFVENAVKHGVATLQDSGLINIRISKQNNDLILLVTDNGQSFDKTAVQTKPGSFGLKLSEERVALLTQVHPDQPVQLVIDTKETGTTITITLANLLS